MFDSLKVGQTQTVLDFCRSLIERLKQIKKSKHISYIHIGDVEMYAYGISKWCFAKQFKWYGGDPSKPNADLSISKIEQSVYNWLEQVVYNDVSDAEKLSALFTTQLVDAHLYGERDYMPDGFSLKGVFDSHSNDRRRYGISSSLKRTFTQRSGGMYTACVPESSTLKGHRLGAKREDFEPIRIVSPGESFFFHMLRCPLSESAHDLSFSVSPKSQELIKTDIVGNWVDDDVSSHSNYYVIPRPHGSIPLRWVVSMDGEKIPWAGTLKESFKKFKKGV